jgi:methionyl-tRNA synthetase
MLSKKNFYITTPIYYVNDSPHLGHAYTNIASDVLARYHRICGNEVYFLTGTDEHGQKVQKAAEDKKISPQVFTDEVSNRFRDLASNLNLTNDGFIRTTEPRHIKAAQALWNKLMENGHIYLHKYAGWYSVRDEAFYQENELIDGKAPTGAPVEWVEEPSYFFDLSKWQDKLLEYYEQNPDFILPKSRKAEVISFVKSGLKDLSISRTSFNWGVPVPNDNKHIMYVWLDALTNYISAIGYPDIDNNLFKEFWPANIHMVGKDILRFHAIYWPAFLMAADLPLPKHIVAHGWWMNEGQKMSKSIGNVIDPNRLINEYGLDQARYYMLREVPFGNDGNFSRVNLINRVNSELANNIGNLAQRTLSMIVKHCDNKVPEIKIMDEDLLIFVQNAVINYQKYMELCQFSDAIEQIVSIGVKANIYIDVNAPWNLRKNDIVKMGEVLANLVHMMRYIGILLLPFIPEAAAKLLDMIGVDNNYRNINDINKHYAFGDLGNILPLFPRLDDEKNDIN